MMYFSQTSTCNRSVYAQPGHLYGLSRQGWVAASGMLLSMWPLRHHYLLTKAAQVVLWEIGTQERPVRGRSCGIRCCICEV